MPSYEVVSPSKRKERMGPERVGNGMRDGLSVGVTVTAVGVLDDDGVPEDAGVGYVDRVGLGDGVPVITVGVPVRDGLAVGIIVPYADRDADGDTVTVAVDETVGKDELEEVPVVEADAVEAGDRVLVCVCVPVTVQLPVGVAEPVDVLDGTSPRFQSRVIVAQAP